MVEETILPEALRDVALGDDVIEVGPGPGLTTDVLRTLTARLTVVEFDSDLARALAQRLVGTNVEVVYGDATAMDLADDRFSGAASFHMLHHIPTAQAQDSVFAELARVLRPGGVLVAADGIENEATRQFHSDDVYNPIDPESLDLRLTRNGFISTEVRVYDIGWICTALCPA
jgi:SAM-dependent methyltransferase